MSQESTKKYDEAPQGRANDLSFLSRGGEMGERMRAFDWSSSPVGPPAEWPRSLKTDKILQDLQELVLSVL